MKTAIIAAGLALVAGLAAAAPADAQYGNRDGYRGDRYHGGPGYRHGGGYGYRHGGYGYRHGYGPRAYRYRHHGVRYHGGYGHGGRF